MHASKNALSLALATALLAACGSAPEDSAQASDMQAQAPGRLGFDKTSAGELPAGWRTGSTKPSGPTATWKVVAAPGAPSAPHVLAMTAHANTATSTFNLCWSDSLRFKEGTLRVLVRADGGEDDQGGGPMWRVKDADNYYVCRWNPLEKNFRLYHVVGGTRKQLASATVEPDPASWQVIEVQHAGGHIRCWLGKTMIEASDDTLPDEGGVGVWTKADALTSFDDLRVETGKVSPMAVTPAAGG